MGTPSPQKSYTGTLPSTACEIRVYSAVDTQKTIIDCSVFVQKQAPSEMLQKESFIAVKDTSKSAAKGQLGDIYTYSPTPEDRGQTTRHIYIPLPTPMQLTIIIIIIIIIIILYS